MPETESVISLTDVAAEHMRKTLQEKKLDDYGLRVYVSGGGCSGFQYGMAFENKVAEDDNVSIVNGIKVIVDPMSLIYLAGTTVDFVDSLMAGGFKIENPNATSTCACGQSFAAAAEVREAMGGGAGCQSCGH